MANYSTMQLAVANNNSYLLARGDAGVDTWRFDTGTSTWTQVGNNNPPWSDALGWADVANYSTMQLAVANNNLYLLARGNVDRYLAVRPRCIVGEALPNERHHGNITPGRPTPALRS